MGVSEGEEEDGDSDGESSGSDGDDCSVGERGLSDEERDVTNGEDTNPIRVRYYFKRGGTYNIVGRAVQMEPTILSVGRFRWNLQYCR